MLYNNLKELHNSHISSLIFQEVSEKKCPAEPGKISEE